MRRLHLLAALLALLAAPSALAGPGLKVGAVEDAAVWSNAGAQMDLAKLAGFDSVRMTAQWTNGQTSLPRAHMNKLQTAVTAAVARGIQPVVSIYNANSANTPYDDTQRARFVQFVRNTVSALPWVTTFIVGNEPNSNVYWMPQFDSAGGNAAAASYERLLADSYDAIKALRPNATVIGGALDPRGGDDPAGSKPSHSPTTFIRDLGGAYRASGRTKPLMDVFDMHGYADNSSLPPSMPHTSNTISTGDYAKLVLELGRAFDGTAQRGSNLPILYGEFGVESVVPPTVSGAYQGTEPATSGAVAEATQARYYTEAFKLALCQPNVIGILVFHVVDESSLGAWQSGPFYANGSPKTSLGPIRDAANAARSGSLATCPDKTAPKVSFTGPAADGTITVDASDDIGVGKVELLANGVVQGIKFAAPYAFKWTPRSEGRYDLEVRATDAAGNAGRATTALTAVKGGASWTFGTPPLNDLFSEARSLSSWNGMVLGSTTFAASERGEPVRRSVWYRWTAPASGALDVSAGGAQVSVYTGGSIRGLRSLAAPSTKVRITAQRGKTYRIAVLGGRTFLLAWKRG